MRGRSSSALGWLCAAFVVAAPPAFGGARIGVYSEGDSGFPDGTAGSFAGIASSPDGGTLYVAGGVDDALVLFARDDVTGRLRGAGLQREGEDGVDGLVVAVAAAVSPDSRFVYTASNGEGGKVAVFERTPGADPLQFREVQVEGVADVTGLSGARALAVTPDGGQLLVAGFDHVVAFARAADGTLEFVESEPIGGGTIRGFHLSADGRSLYATDTNDRLYVLSRNPASGALAVVDSFDATGPLDAVTSTRSGRDVFVVEDDRLLRFARDPVTTALTPAAPVAFPLATAVHAIAAAPDADRVYVSLTEDAAGVPVHLVRTFEIDAESGGISPAGGWSAEGGARKRLAATASHLYHLTVDGAGAAAIAMLAVDVLLPVETESDGSAGASALDGAASAAPSPDGAHLYVAGFEDDAVQIFARDPSTGALLATGAVREGDACLQCLGSARALAIAPDGAHVYVAADAADVIAVFSRNAATGALAWVESESGGACALGSVRDLALSPDGRDLFAVSASADLLCRFTRDAASGALAFADSDSGPGSGFADPDAVAVAPDGHTVYVADNLLDAIVPYARDPSTGEIARMATVTDDEGFDSLDGATELALSRDGRFLYVASLAGNAVTTFARNLATGALTLRGSEVDGAGVIAGLETPIALALAPDGRALVVAGEAGTVAFRRSPASGAIGYAQWIPDPQGSFDVAFARTGTGVYVPSFVGDRVEVYAPEPGAWPLAGASALALAGLRRRFPGLYPLWQDAPRRPTIPGACAGLAV